MDFSTSRIKHQILMQKGFDNFYRKLSDREAEIVTNELLECLQVFNTVCEEYNLDYMILAGALIGAVRDGNLLPWDDDIDLVMPREDYEKLKRLFPRNRYAKNYNLIYPEDNTIITMGCHFYNKNHNLKKLISEEVGNSNIYESFAYLDILPLDNCSNSRVVNKIRGTLVDILQMGYISRRCYAKNDPFLYYLSKDSFALKINLFIRKVFSFPFLLIPKRMIFNQLKALSRGDKNSKKMTIAYGALRYFGEELPREVFLPTKDIVVNNVSSKGPNDADAYLSHRYGDYMKIPSEEEQELRMVRLRGNWWSYVTKK